jgi:hypothetical protein
MDTIEKAIEDIREGKFVIVVDDEDRENEGDFIIAAEKITPEKVNFMLCLNNLHMAKQCNENGIKFYWGYPIFTYYELNSVKILNPSYLVLGAPLSFSLDRVKAKTQIPIRLCPNLAYDAYIPRTDGICGTWIRPEDVTVYEKYIDVFEFETTELEKESTLLHVYKDNQNWPGNLNLLFTNFGVNVDNKAIPEEIGHMRSVCGQRCMSDGTCHFCEHAIRFASNIRDRYITEVKEHN